MQLLSVQVAAPPPHELPEVLGYGVPVTLLLNVQLISSATLAPAPLPPVPGHRFPNTVQLLSVPE
jgi:hypothetical protein